MNTTSVSLLERLRVSPEEAAWERFVALYTPLLVEWARRLRLQDADASDLVQDVFVTLVKQLPEFHYDPQKCFRSWLHTVMLNRWCDWQRRRVGDCLHAGYPLSQLPQAREPLELDELEYHQYLVARALQLIQNEFGPRIWKAGWEHLVGDRPAAEVAAELGICVGSVYVAKSRILARLRIELAGLID